MNTPRVNIPQEHFTQFFGALVGTPEATERFKAGLSAVVLSEEPSARTPNLPNDPYGRLLYGTTDAINRVVEEAVASPDLTADEMKAWGNIHKNGIFGAKTIISAIRAVGDLYKTNARKPQLESNVRANMRRALGHVIGIAHEGGTAKNMIAAQQGLDPTNPRHQIIIELLVEAHRQAYKEEGQKPPASVEKAFQANGRWSWGGQLVISPRFRRLRTDRDRFCPTVDTKVGLAEGGRANGLWVMMEAMGDVAISHIFPKQFRIMPD